MPVQELTPLHLSVDSEGLLVHETQSWANFGATLKMVIAARDATCKPIRFKFRGYQLVVDAFESEESVVDRYRDMVDLEIKRRHTALIELRATVNQHPYPNSFDYSEFLGWLVDYLTCVNDNGYSDLVVSSDELVTALKVRGFEENAHIDTPLSVIYQDIRLRAEALMGQVLVYAREKKIVPSRMIGEIRTLIELMKPARPNEASK